MKKKTEAIQGEIVKKETSLEPRMGTPAEMIANALSTGADLDRLEGLLNLQMKWEANEAKKAYHKAMAEFKTNPPKIEKDKRVSYGAGKTSYSHASLYNVTDKINSALSKYGLSASWIVAQNGSVSVTCRITHEKGHFEETTLTAPADTSGSKNAIQAIGSTITYLERYSLLALTGLATEGQDDDGATVNKEPIDEEQFMAIRDYLAATGANEEKFLAYLKIESIEKMPKSLFQKAITALKSKEKKGEKK